MPTWAIVTLSVAGGVILGIIIAAIVVGKAMLEIGNHFGGP